MTTYADIQATENEGNDYEGYTRAQLRAIRRELISDKREAVKFGHRADAASYQDDIDEIAAILS